MQGNKRFQRLGFFIAILTLTILSCQSVAGFNPSTPTATATFTLTATFIPSPAPSSTSTPTIAPSPEPSGVKIEKQPDASTLFIDSDNKYQLSLPKDWTVIPFDKEGLAVVMDELEKDNPNLVNSAKAFKDLDPLIFRLAALNTNPEFLANGYATNLNITAVENTLLSDQPLASVTGVLKEAFKQQGIKVLTEGENIIANAQGVEIELIDLEQSIKGITVAQRAIVFISNNKLIVITTTTPEQVSKDLFLPDDLIGGSIKLLK